MKLMRNPHSVTARWCCGVADIWYDTGGLDWRRVKMVAQDDDKGPAADESNRVMSPREAAAALPLTVRITLVNQCSKGVVFLCSDESHEVAKRWNLFVRPRVAGVWSFGTADFGFCKACPPESRRLQQERQQEQEDNE